MGYFSFSLKFHCFEWNGYEAHQTPLSLVAFLLYLSYWPIKCRINLLSQFVNKKQRIVRHQGDLNINCGTVVLSLMCVVFYNQRPLLFKSSFKISFMCT